MRRNVRRLVTGTAFLLPALACSVIALAAASGDMRLLDASKRHDTAAVRTLLKAKPDVNLRYPDGATALHWAAHWGDADLANLLIRAGANVNAADDLGVTPLALAAKVGSAAIVQQLLAAGANPNVALKAGETPLMLAARAGSLPAVTALLHKGAKVEAKEIKGQTALMWAAAEKHPDIVQALLAGGGDANARSQGRYTPLLFAARANDIESARLLLAAGAHLEDGDGDGNTPLVVATLMGNVPMVSFLVDKGANINAAGGGFTALHWAAGFWDHGFSTWLKTEDSEWSHLAGLRGDAKYALAKYLVDHGADVNVKFSKNPRFGGLDAGGIITLSLIGGTPLLMAANAADVRLMHLLLDHGADRHVKLANGTTMLMLALGVTRANGAALVTEAQAMAAARLALELGDDINAANSNGETAIEAAAYHGYDSIIPFLVEKGANLNPKNRNGDTPFLIANGQGPRVAGDNPYQPTTAMLLKKLGADTTGECAYPCLSALLSKRSDTGDGDGADAGK